MVTGIAVHEGSFGDAEVGRVTEPESQPLGVELDDLGRRVAEEERVPDAQVACDELDPPGRNERAVVDLLPVERLELVTVTVGEHDEAANLTVTGQLVIRSHVDALGRERRWPGRGASLNGDAPGPLVGAQPNLIGRMTCGLSSQQVGTEALPLLHGTLNNDVAQGADSAHDGVLSTVSTGERPYGQVAPPRGIVLTTRT